jgi:hypothetical protein
VEADILLDNASARRYDLGNVDAQAFRKASRAGAYRIFAASRRAVCRFVGATA